MHCKIEAGRGFQGQGGSSFLKGCLPHAHKEKFMGIGARGDRKRVLGTRHCLAGSGLLPALPHLLSFQDSI